MTRLLQNTNMLVATNLLAAAVVGNARNGATVKLRQLSNMPEQLLPAAVNPVSV